jgi:mannose-6-phosphate isomerase-like protein (cupin superfamily)
MRLRVLGLAAVAAVVCGAAAAPPAPSSMTEATFITQADIAALIAKAPSLGTPGQANIIQPLLSVPPYSLALEFRAIAGPAAAHPDDAELFVVVQGAGAMTTGGRLVRPAAGPAGIEGGSTRRVAKGDVLLVPAGVPHAFIDSDGSLAVMTIKLPLERPAAGSPAR